MAEQILYRFTDLSLAQFAILDENCTDDEKPIELSCSFQFSFSFDEHVVCCKTSVVITKEINRPVIKAVLNSYFKISRDSMTLISDADGIVLPIELMTQFASLGYSTMRGIIYSHTAGSSANKIILPPNDFQSVFSEPAKFRKYPSCVSQ